MRTYIYTYLKRNTVHVSQWDCFDFHFLYYMLLYDMRYGNIVIGGVTCLSVAPNVISPSLIQIPNIYT